MKNLLERLKVAGPTLIVIAALLWALDGILRRSLYDLPPVTIIFFEHFIGLLILLPFFWKSLFTEKLTQKEWFIMILVAALSGVCGTLWFTTALLKVNFISFSVVFLLQKLQPIFAISTARIFLKEPISKKYIKWALLALVAAYFVTFKNGYVSFATGAGTIVAALYAFGAAFAWGSSTTFSKMVLTTRNSTFTTGLRFLLTTILAFPLVILFGKFATLGALTPKALITLMAIALSTGMVALLIYYRGLKLTPVRISTILELTFPFVAVFIDVVLYHTVLGWTQYLAAVVLIFAMYQVARLNNQEKKSYAA